MKATYTLEFARAADSLFALAASPDFARDGLCFAACSSGIYRSEDGGASWRLLRASSETVTTALALSPSFADDRSLFAAVKGGLLRSSDAGDNWYTAGFPAPPPVFSSLLVSPDFERDGFILAATLEDGVFSSTDRGLRWQPWNFGLFDLAALCLAMSPDWTTDETVYVGTETGLYQSSNGGRAWRHSGFPSELAPVLCLAAASSQESGDMKIYAGTEMHGLHLSCDGGENWERLAADAMPDAVNQLYVTHDERGGASLYALKNDGVLQSDDEGRSWSQVIRSDGAATAMLPLCGVIFLGVLGKGVMRLPRN